MIRLQAGTRIEKTLFGQLHDGRRIDRYRVSNKTGAWIDVSSLGATLLTINIPDRDGKISDVILGFDNPNQYMSDNSYFGGIIGRFANRISNGKVSIHGKYFNLSINDGPHSLHGGKVGFDKRVWESRIVRLESSELLELTLCSPHGDQGYPGNLRVKCSICFDDQNRLTIDYSAETDMTTIINLTHHPYFNLNGQGAGHVRDHYLLIPANFYLPVDDELIPTGAILEASGSMDFRKPKTLDEGLNSDDPQLLFAGGYDHNWVLNNPTFNPGLHLAAKLYSKNTGRALTIKTDQPGIQFYSGNSLSGSIKGKNDVFYQRHAGLALETQHFPDSPNQPGFPSTLLFPGKIYRTRTEWHFDPDVYSNSH
ncbi:MAG: galactose mutarotase [Gammaproteobacteria bacterium TMED1]|nr:MAG: galactose mutarotase [Gammaproteobacteria bacterium TMED1]|tara:strand:- start:4553 stop:5653 length:1101 start_codon:yes stop_codon:yes gene_type:complete